MDGTAKVTLQLELKNKIKSALGDAKNILNKDVQDMKGKIGELSTSTKQGLSGFGNSIKNLLNFGNLEDKIDGLKAHSTQAFEAIENEVPGVSSALGLLANPYVLGTAAIGGFIEAGKKAVETYEDWEEHLLKANAVLQLSENDLGKVNDQLNEIAAHGKGKWAFTDVPDAFNEIVRSGRDANEALKELEPTMKAAKANQTDLILTSKTATDLMNSSDIKDITEIYDMIGEIEKKGHIGFEQIGSTLPSLSITAKDVGFNLKDAAAALVTLTAKGEDANRVSSRLEMTFRTMLDDQHIKAFKQLGIDVYDNRTHKIRTLLDILEQFNKVTHGMSDQDRQSILSFLQLDSRTGAAFLDLAQSTDDLRKNMHDITNSAGELERQAKATESPFDKFRETSNEIKAAWNDAGKNITKSLSTGNDGINEMVSTGVPSLIKAFGNLFIFIDQGFRVIDLSWQGIKKPFIDDYSIMFGPKTNKDAKVYGQITPDEAKQQYNQLYKPFIGTDKFDFRSLGGTDKPKTNVYKLSPEQTKILNEIKEQNNNNNSSSSNDDGHITGSTPRTVNITIGNVIGGDWVTKNEKFQNMSPQEFANMIIELLKRAEENAEKGYS